MTSDCRKIPTTPTSSVAKLSVVSSSAGRSVHPYRGRREALIERRRRVAQDVEEADRAIARRSRAIRHLALIDEELRAYPSPLSNATCETTRCAASWDDMVGDEVVRQCGRCRREVFDPQQMSEAELAALMRRAEADGQPRLCRRPDGRVVEAPCPSGPPRRVNHTVRNVGIGVVGGASLVFFGSLGLWTMSDWLSAATPRAAPDLEDVTASAVVAAPPVATAPDPVVAPVSSPPEEVDRIADHFAPPLDSAGAAPAEVANQIRWLGPRYWEIDRSALTQWISSQPALVRTTRIIPHEVDGRPVGVKIFGIRPGDTLYRLGIRSGDLLYEVNGESLVEPDAALRAYARVHETSAFFVRLQRRGEERVHIYRVIEDR